MESLKLHVFLEYRRVFSCRDFNLQLRLRSLKCRDGTLTCLQGVWTVNKWKTTYHGKWEIPISAVDNCGLKIGQMRRKKRDVVDTKHNALYRITRITHPNSRRKNSICGSLQKIMSFKYINKFLFYRVYVFDLDLD